MGLVKLISGAVTRFRDFKCVFVCDAFFFYAPIHRVGVYSVCVYVAASVCRTWHAYRTAVWSLEYDKQNHRNTSTALLDIQMPFWAMADSAKISLLYPKYFHFCDRCY